jgi:hypothetical protein
MYNPILMLSDEPPKDNEEQPHKWGLPDPSQSSPNVEIDSDDERLAKIAEAQLLLSSDKHEDEIIAELPHPAPYQQRDQSLGRHDSPLRQYTSPLSEYNTQDANSSSTDGGRMTRKQFQSEIEQMGIPREWFDDNDALLQDYLVREYEPKGVGEMKAALRAWAREPTDIQLPTFRSANLQRTEIHNIEPGQAGSLRLSMRDDLLSSLVPEGQMSIEASEREPPDLPMPDPSLVPPSPPAIAPLQNLEPMQTSSLAASSQVVANPLIQLKYVNQFLGLFSDSYSSQSEVYYDGDIPDAQTSVLDHPELKLPRKLEGSPTVNSAGTLVIIPVSEFTGPDGIVFVLELWDIPKVKKIWRSPQLARYRQVAFSPDGALFAYIDFGPGGSPIFSIWKVSESQVSLHNTLDLRRVSNQAALPWRQTFDVKKSHEFAISNNGDHIAFAFDSQVTGDPLVNFWHHFFHAKIRIDIVTSLVKCQLHYNDNDDGNLYCLLVLHTNCLFLYIWDGTVSRLCTHPLGGEMVDGLRNHKIMLSRNFICGSGSHIVVVLKVHGDFRPKFKRLFSRPEMTTRLQLLYLQEDPENLVYSTTTYDSVQVLSKGLFVDTARQTVSYVPVPGEEIGGLPFNKQELDRYKAASNSENLVPDLVPVGMEWKHVTCVNDQGALYRFRVDHWQWF